MADNNNPLFAITPKFATANVSAANTNRDGSGTVATLFTAVKKTKITMLGYKSAVTTTAGMIRFYITDTAGANPCMFLELSVAATTVSATVQSAEGWKYYPDFEIEAGQIITVSTHNAESSTVFMQAGELES